MKSAISNTRFSPPAWLRPRSVLSLVLSGFALAGLPFAAGLIFSSLQIGKLSEESEALLVGAVTLTQSTRGVLNQLATLERATRQLLVLRDADARAGYREARIAFREQVRVTASLETGAAMHERLDRLLARESTLARAVELEHGEAVWPPVLARGFHELDALGQALVTKSEVQADEAAARLQRIGARAQTVVLWQFIIVLVVAGVLALVFTNLITRPIGVLDRAIRSLGNPRASNGWMSPPWSRTCWKVMP